MEKNISGTGDGICKAFEFRKNLRVLRDERRAKVSGARRKVEQGEAEQHSEKLSPEVDASPSTMEMNSYPEVSPKLNYSALSYGHGQFIYSISWT